MLAISSSAQISAGEQDTKEQGIAHQAQTSWVDDFHMNYGLLFSEGGPVNKIYADQALKNLSRFACAPLSAWALARSVYDTHGYDF